MRELKKSMIMNIKNEQNESLDESLLKEVIKIALSITKEAEKRRIYDHKGCRL